MDVNVHTVCVVQKLSRKSEKRWATEHKRFKTLEPERKRRKGASEWKTNQLEFVNETTSETIQAKIVSIGECAIGWVVPPFITATSRTKNF